MINKYDYQGQKLSIPEIARLNEIDRNVLLKNFQRLHDLDAAIELTKLKKAVRHGSINYHGQMMTMAAIAELEQVDNANLARRYAKTGDIEQAVALVKAGQEHLRGEFVWRGARMTLSAVAAQENLVFHGLRQAYQETGDIEQAVALAKQRQQLRAGAIEWKGAMRTIKAIGEMEGVNSNTLGVYYRLYGNMEKALLVTRAAVRKRAKVVFRGQETSYAELAQYFGMSRFKLEKLLASGQTPDQIEQKLTAAPRRNLTLQMETGSLYQYCLEHHYNYRVIYNLVAVYGKTPAQAVEIYLTKGQQIPVRWIYEKYGLLFKHLMLSFGLDSAKLVRLMKANQYGIDAALEDYIFAEPVTGKPFNASEVGWLQECYQFLRELPSDAIPAARQELLLDDREMAFIENKGTKIEQVKRRLLLFEFAEIMDQWPANELQEMMDAYGITAEEKKLIEHDLRQPFTDKILNPKKKLSTFQGVKNNTLTHDKV